MSRRHNRYNNDFQVLQSKVLLLYNDIRDAQLLENDTNVLAAIRGLADTTEKIAHRLRQIENIAGGDTLHARPVAEKQQPQV
jgi:hypothetical protein